MFIISLVGWEGEVRWFKLHIPKAENAKFPLRAEWRPQNSRISPQSLWNGSPQVPWAISSCLFASPRAEKRSSLILVSALRLFSRCWVLSCMAESADINTSVSFSFSLYFLSSCGGKSQWEWQKCQPGGQKYQPGGQKMSFRGQKCYSEGKDVSLAVKIHPGRGKNASLRVQMPA